MSNRDEIIRDLLTLPRINGEGPAPRARSGRLHMYLTHDPNGWRIKAGQQSKVRVSKSEAKRVAILWAGDLVGLGHTVSLKIAGTDGKFQEERTYPRSSDPSETPG